MTDAMQRTIVFLYDHHKTSPSRKIVNKKVIDTKREDPSPFQIVEIRNSLEFTIGDWVKQSQVREMCKGNKWNVIIMNMGRAQGRDW